MAHCRQNPNRIDGAAMTEAEQTYFQKLLAALRKRKAWLGLEKETAQPEEDRKAAEFPQRLS